MARVGLLVNSLNTGGAERVVSRLSYILAADHEIFLILYTDKFMNYEYNGTLINLGVDAEKNKIKKIFVPIKRVSKLKKIKKDYRLDVVISFMDSPNIVNLLSKTKNCKAVVSIRNFPGLEKESTGLAKAVDNVSKRLYHKADKIVTVADEISDYMRVTNPTCADRVVTIYNPYDLEHIDAQRKMPIESAEHVAFMKDHRCIISVGRNMHQKGFWHLIKAFSVVAKKHEDARLVIVGGNIYEKETEKLISDLGLENKILLTGAQKNPFAYIERSEIYVLSSLFEGFPNAMVEAMACGKPVVAANCKSGPKEILMTADERKTVVDRVTQASYGILISEMPQQENWDANILEDQDAQLAEAIDLLLSDEALHCEYGKKAREKSLDFDYDTCRSKFGAVIDSVL